MTAPRLSVVVITLDEEAHIRRCLESVAWADEIVVVDAESRDKTVQIAREFTDRVISRPWPGFTAQKNFALAQSTAEWIFSLDADEEASPELRDEIGAAIADPGAADGYAVRRRNVFLGWQGGAWTPPTHDALLYLVNHLPARVNWNVSVMDPMQWRIHALAIAMGGHVRVGWEDNPFLPDGTPSSRSVQTPTSDARGASGGRGITALRTR